MQQQSPSFDAYEFSTNDVVRVDWSDGMGPADEVMGVVTGIERSGGEVVVSVTDYTLPEFADGKTYDAAAEWVTIVEAADPADPPANERVRLVSWITGVTSAPTIVSGETSSTGKTIQVEDPTGSSTYRLDASAIFAGEAEYRDATGFELYTVGRYQAKQRANYAPGPQAGADGVADAHELPSPTHWPATVESSDAPGTCPNCKLSYWQTENLRRPRCEACGHLA